MLGLVAAMLPLAMLAGCGGDGEERGAATPPRTETHPFGPTPSDAPRPKPGAPIVAARPSATEGAIVTIVVGWELSWYRYEVDLGDEASGVRVSGQGAELSELDPADQAPNATADERGELHPVAGVA